VRGDEAKRVSAALAALDAAATHDADAHRNSRDAREEHKATLAALLRQALTATKGQVLVVTSAELNGAVTRTLKKCTDAKVRALFLGSVSFSFSIECASVWVRLNYT